MLRWRWRQALRSRSCRERLQTTASCISTTADVVNVAEKALLEGVRYGSERRIE
jgi:hypothetical protein